MNDNAKSMTKGPGWGIAWGILTIVFGLLAMSAPLVSGLAVTLLIGYVLLGGGIAMLIFAFQAPSLGKVLLKLLFAVLTVVAGLAVIFQPGLALAQLTWPESKWAFGEPDYIIKVPPQEIPATGVLDYIHVIVPIDTDKDYWVQGSQYVAGDRTVLHHTLNNLIPPDAGNRRRGFLGGGVLPHVSVYLCGNRGFLRDCSSKERRCYSISDNLRA